MKSFALALFVASAQATEWADQYYGYGGYGHGHSHTHDSNSTVDKSTWWSPYQQYSPIRIPYKPAGNKKTTYAICDIDDTNKIQLAQLPGKSTQAKVNFTGLTADAVYALRVNEYGRDENACADVGDEYNPLTEKDKLDRPNPYQDPTRGRLANVTVDASGVATDLVQKGILLNLSGYGSIMGRSMTLFATDSDGAPTGSALGCCVIGVDAKPTPTSSTDHHHHGYGYQRYPAYSGYGGYGGSSYGHGPYGGYGRQSHSHGNSFW